MAKFIPVNNTSWDSGLCDACSHLKTLSAQPYCDVPRLCGQVMACRCQARALVVGRQSCGRVRKKPLQRVTPLKKDLPKPAAWAKTHERFIALGDKHKLVWVGTLSNAKQAMARKFIKQGKMSAYHITSAMVRGVPVLYIKMEDFDKLYRSWDEYTGKGE